jgi:hypothetical protein
VILHSDFLTRNTQSYLTVTRSNGYYSTFTYFSSKILFDILPLRVVPPLVYGSIVYGRVGLVSNVGTFWKFMLTLVLFNLTTASVILSISVAFASLGVATLVGTLVMLFKYANFFLEFVSLSHAPLSLLFAGLLINADTLPPAISWLNRASFFHAAFEALAVNELRTLQLTENKASHFPATLFYSKFPATVWSRNRCSFGSNLADVRSESPRECTPFAFFELLRLTCAPGILVAGYCDTLHLLRGVHRLQHALTAILRSGTAIILGISHFDVLRILQHSVARTQFDNI